MYPPRSTASSGVNHRKGRVARLAATVPVAWADRTGALMMVDTRGGWRVSRPVPASSGVVHATRWPPEDGQDEPWVVAQVAAPQSSRFPVEAVEPLESGGL